MLCLPTCALPTCRLLKPEALWCCSAWGGSSPSSSLNPSLSLPQGREELGCLSSRSQKWPGEGRVESDDGQVGRKGGSWLGFTLCLSLSSCLLTCPSTLPSFPHVVFQATSGCAWPGIWVGSPGASPPEEEGERLETREMWSQVVLWLGLCRPGEQQQQQPDITNTKGGPVWRILPSQACAASPTPVGRASHGGGGTNLEGGGGAQKKNGPLLPNPALGNFDPRHSPWAA